MTAALCVIITIALCALYFLAWCLCRAAARADHQFDHDLEGFS